jgi:nucleotide-binding universal stress UspA family protein
MQLGDRQGIIRHDFTEADMKPQFHLPVITYPDASSFTVVDNALELAQHNNADLIASILQIRIPPVRKTFPTVIDVERMSSDAARFSRDSGAALVEFLKDHAQKAAVDVRIAPFEEEGPFVANRLSELSRAYDLSIVEASETTRPVTESLLFQSGRPVVLFPASNFSGRIDTVAIAWDGGPTAAKAVSGARVLMQRATKAIVISLIDDKPIDEAARDRFGAALRAAGFQVDIVSAERRDMTAGNAIQAAAAEGRADLLVAGAYGHSKFREFVLGGVTRDLLSTLEMPALLSH